MTSAVTREEVCPVQTREKGSSSDVDICCQKTSGFSKIMVCLHGQGG